MLFLKGRIIVFKIGSLSGEGLFFLHFISSIFMKKRDEK